MSALHDPVQSTGAGGTGPGRGPSRTASDQTAQAAGPLAISARNSSLLLVVRILSMSSSRPAAALPVGGQGVEHPAQLPDLLELAPLEQELLVAGGAGVDVDRRVEAALGQATVEAELHVAGALELLEDHLVHLRARSPPARWPGW